MVLLNSEEVSCNDHHQVDVVAAAGLQCSGDMLGDKQLVSQVILEGLEIEEPPADEMEAAEKKAGISRLMAGYVQHLQHRSAYHLGYPLNFDYDFSPLAPFLNFSLNNAGDPFAKVNNSVHSRQFEVAVLNWFANFWDVQRDQFWGYITSGGTEGNLYGLLVGRELFPDGILYASNDSHYSVFKAAKMYRVKCIRIATTVSGEMNYADLKSKLQHNTNSPAIINANIGTTFKGAVDDIDQIISTLEKCGFQNRYYIHCDSALSGMMTPFMKQAPKVSFKKPIGSISVSGHKFLGCPMPCGVVITRLEHAEVLSTDIEYIASRDSTITGSRNGHAPIFLWYTLSKKGYKGLLKEVHICMGNARYLEVLLKQVGISASCNTLSNIVVFERPKDERIVCRWQLACEGNLAHIVVMPNVTFEKLTVFVEELAEKRNDWYQDKGFDIPCLAVDIGKENCYCNLHAKKLRIPKM
uniref:Serine decarboxylase n=1 Tax=Oryza nivara TaxID=4536 RepID=A0A0E0INX8_ORYNI